ncbi:Ankyrin repeat domain-containing protein 11 [Ophiophagus hannah]|uniref:Ankyrin repeat domain-containing protein 11 n=1 Tax=Ophiophagus hannah TaxID=8665 RepID=V8NVM7_OPHHA|nr:Ankyrin repeat domain-containing protein 11 [Ophiophagus hannah]
MPKGGCSKTPQSDDFSLSNNMVEKQTGKKTRTNGLLCGHRYHFKERGLCSSPDSPGVQNCRWSMGSTGALPCAPKAPPLRSQKSSPEKLVSHIGQDKDKVSLTKTPKLDRSDGGKEVKERATKRKLPFTVGTNGDQKDSDTGKNIQYDII